MKFPSFSPWGRGLLRSQDGTALTYSLFIFGSLCFVPHFLGARHFFFISATFKYPPDSLIEHPRNLQSGI